MTSVVKLLSTLPSFVINVNSMERALAVRVFKSRLVNKVKGKTTETPYEKSRLVIQAFNDMGKESI
jgi:hypothetical protein